MDNYLDTSSAYSNELPDFENSVAFDDLKLDELLNQFSVENHNRSNEVDVPQVVFSPSTLMNSANANSFPSQQLQQSPSELNEVKLPKKRVRNSQKNTTEKKARKIRNSKSAPSPVKNEEQLLPFDEVNDDLFEEDDNDELSAIPSGERKKRLQDNKLSKNREAAQQFRQRQRAHIAALEQKVKELTTLRAQYTAQTQMLEAENKLIRAQVNYLRGFLSQALAVAFSQQLPQLLLAQTAASHTSIPPQVPLHTTLGPIDV
jgi:hypothetical protein